MSILERLPHSPTGIGARNRPVALLWVPPNDRLSTHSKESDRYTNLYRLLFGQQSPCRGAETAQAYTCPKREADSLPTSSLLAPPPLQDNGRQFPFEFRSPIPAPFFLRMERAGDESKIRRESRRWGRGDTGSLHRDLPECSTLLQRAHPSSK